MRNQSYELEFYSDGGTREYLGLGYKVIAYAIIEEERGLTGEVTCKMGTWFLSYDYDFPRYKLFADGERYAVQILMKKRE